MKSTSSERGHHSSNIPIGLDISWIVWMFLSMNVQNLGGKAVITASVQQPPRKIVKVVSRICLHEERIGDHEFFYAGLYKYL
ncbi:hypothetical protein D3C73_1594450 [compost metagenome]